MSAEEVAPIKPKTRTVILAIDASEHAERAFNYYFEYIHRADNEVVFAHSAEYPRMPFGQQIPTEQWEQEIAKREKDMRQLEESYRKRLTDAKVVNRSRFVYHSKPGEAICHIAQEENANLIVTGTRGLGAIRRTVLGSVSDYVVHHAKVPVLICPPAKHKHHHHFSFGHHHHDGKHRHHSQDEDGKRRHHSHESCDSMDSH